MLFILFLLLKSSFFKLHDLVTATCDRHNAEKGKFICTVESASDVTSYECRVPNHSCQAQRTEFTPPTTSDSSSKGSLKFEVTLIMSAYTDEDVEVTVKHSGMFWSSNIADPFTLEYHFGSDEKPRIECNTPISIDDPYITKSTCQVYLKIDTDSITTTDDNLCTIALSDSISHPNGFLSQKVYTVTITDSENKCNKECNPTLSLPSSYKRVTISKSLNHVSRCQEPIIHIIGHDKFARRIDCVLEISYEFASVELVINTAGVTLGTTTTTFTKETLQSAHNQFSFTYTISDFSKENFQITIDFKVYQSTNILTHTISKTITYQPKLEEKPKIECEEKTNVLKTLTNTYKCNFISKTSPITIQTDTHGYVITPSTAQTLDAHHSIFKKEIDVRITATNVVCNKKQLIKLHFGQPSTVFFFVSHKTSCPEPTIGCSTHNSIERIINCQFKVEFTFIRMVLISQNPSITLNPIEFKPADLNSAAIISKEIKYKLTDLRMGSNKKFNILFKVMQSHHHIAYEKSLGFEYVLKEDELSHLTCNPTNKLQNDHWSAVRLFCSSVSSLWNITLKVGSNDFEIFPKSITGENVHNVYENKNFNLVIKPKSIKCKDKKPVTISFEEEQTSHTYTFTHITNCPNPIISCHRHNMVERKIICNFQSLYEFEKIRLAVSKSSVQIKSSKDITYAKIIPEKKMMVEYEVSELTTQDHEFIIDFTTDQIDNTDIHTLKHSFIYTLSQNEIPGILCHEDLTNPPQPLKYVKYKCTMVFTRASVSLSTDTAKYEIEPTTKSGTVTNGISKEDDVTVTITLKSIVCDQLERINIKMTDNSENYEIFHSRKTICPEPIIYCHTHDEINRELLCKVKVDFPFLSIALSTSHTSVELTTTTISPSSDDKIDEENKKIAYTITKYKNKKHQFDIKFTIRQTGNDKAFEKVLHFTYILKRDETPHISCSLDSPEDNQKFQVNKYSCKIISRQKQISLSIDQQDIYIYIYMNPSGSISLEDYNEIYKIDSHKIKIEPKEIICGRKSEIKVTFKDEDNVHYSDIVSHSTICPEPEIKDFENTRSSRSASWVVETKYEFVDLAVSSDVDNIIIESTIEQIKVSDNVWTRKVTVAYKPHDWSYNEHKFKLINTITPKNASPVSKTTSEITFQLIAEESPKISCTIHTSEILLEFNEKSYVCNMLSRKSTVLLSLSDTKYKIVNSLGVADFENNVYKWNDYKIIIRDMEIKCSKETSFKVSLSDYQTNLETPIKYRTNCPEPEVTCDHSTDSRTIICKVSSKYPYSEVEIKSSNNIRMSKIEKSTIVRSNTKWHSTHTILYELTSFLSSDRSFSLQLDFVQDNSIIHHSSHSFSYVIRNNEKPQISCQPKENVTNLAFGTTIYVCYLVKKNNEIKIEADPNYYEITMKKTNVIKFLDLYKWESLEVQVNDTRIDCNRTMKINLKMKDGDVDELNSAIEHTTHCKEISGECIVSENGGAYIHCNYRSEMSFELKEFACSDQINCSRSEDFSKNADDGQHYIFEINPLTSKDTFEFLFNVTLSYSQYSDVTFSYVLEFHKETVLLPSSSSSDKSVSAAATGTIPVYSLFVVVVITGSVMILVFMKKSTKNKSLIE